MKKKKVLFELEKNIKKDKKQTKEKILLFLIKFICLIIIFAPCDNNLDIASVFTFLIAPLIYLPFVLVITTDIFNIELNEEFIKFCISTQFGTILPTLAFMKLALQI